jgi:hypothetical protein
MLKHHSPWKVRQTGTGVLEWISPTGRSYEDRPPIPPTTIVNDAVLSSGPNSRVTAQSPPF